MSGLILGCCFFCHQKLVRVTRRSGRGVFHFLWWAGQSEMTPTLLALGSELSLSASLYLTRIFLVCRYPVAISRTPTYLSCGIWSSFFWDGLPYHTPNKAVTYYGDSLDVDVAPFCLQPRPRSLGSLDKKGPCIQWLSLGASWQVSCFMAVFIFSSTLHHLLVLSLHSDFVMHLLIFAEMLSCLGSFILDITNTENSTLST